MFLVKIKGPNKWSPYPDLNRRPLPYQGSALPLSYMGKVVTPQLASFITITAATFGLADSKNTSYVRLPPKPCTLYLPLSIFSAYSGAGDRDRTDIISFEGWGSTIELHPHIALNFWWRG